MSHLFLQQQLHLAENKKRKVGGNSAGNLMSLQTNPLSIFPVSHKKNIKTHALSHSNSSTHNSACCFLFSSPGHHLQGGPD